VQYHNVELNRPPIGAYADRLLAAEALVLVYPVWNEGFPAILKGFFDRVFIPGVSFKIGPDGAAIPNLQKLRKLAAVCTYGASRTTSFLLGDPPKRVVKRLVRSMPGHAVRCDYLAYYDMDHSNPEQRAPSWRRLSEHLRLGETVRLAHGRLSREALEGVGYLSRVIWLRDKLAALRQKFQFAPAEPRSDYGARSRGRAASPLRPIA
jgi:NAD(P)H dehydrogenase (quinone)